MTGRRVISFDRIADRYDETRGGMERARGQAELLVGFLPESGPVLEIGVGTGLIAAALAEHGRQVLGTDISTGMLAHAKGRMPGRIMRADGLRLPVADGRLAGCYMVHVLHLVDIGAAVREVARVLRPGGRFVATVASRNSVSSDVGDVLADLGQEVGTIGDRVRDMERDVLRAGRAAGLRLADRTEFKRGDWLESPSVAAQAVDERLWSWMWDCHDDMWAPAAERAVTRLRALPEQDLPRQDRTAFPILALQKG